MAETGFAMGQLSPIMYFENAVGEISLPPTTDEALRIRGEMRRRGWELREANTLPLIDALQKRLQDELRRKAEAANEHDERTVGAASKQVRERLYSRMVSAGTSPYHREFIKQYLMLREDRRGKWRNRFMVDNAYFTLRENNNLNSVKERVDAVPGADETTCADCGKARALRGHDRCFRCLNKG